MTMLNDSTTALSIDRPGHLATGDGDHRWFLNHLATVKVTAGDDGPKMSAVEFTAPRGFGPPLHVHQDEDEIMYVLEGEIRLDLGDTSQIATAGSVVSLPHGVPHVFQVESDQARFLTVTSGGKAHPTFDRFVQELGVETDPTNLPAPGEIDPGHVAQVCAMHGIEVLGPPPAPLD
ncbi:quercetin dioxygenase-like cupin family protein [Ilumatobacter fluminis]|uniref:Quercetin dioxygenase-like cupin family protein n=1 Tax=Ilumatobacter fluminis TaxID=467091 RepID=A0A4R7HWJ1_9ACTN|nr:cupin domain-containing protein [Ilumatobacter fluminis]TDT14526.1 quercetin dioxygenase-like cupin family protein [Ilumatobacter fluminis]